MKQLETRHDVIRKPRIRVVEKDNAYHLDVELPGISESDVDLTFEKGTLKLEAASEALENVRYERYFQLPKTVDTSELSAEMSKGILSLTLPKAKELQPRTIKVLAS